MKVKKPTVKIGVYLSPHEKSDLKVYAAQQGLPLSAVVRYLIINKIYTENK